MGNNSSRPAGSPSPAAGPAGHSSQSQRRYPAARRDSVQASPASTTTASHFAESTHSVPPSLVSVQNLTPKPYPHHHHHRSESLSSDPSPSLSYNSKREERMGNAQSHQAWREKAEIRRREQDQDQQSNPVQVPGSSANDKRQRGPDSQFESSGLPRDPDYIPASNLNFPPRLPLPIQEEVYTPGSPIITPADVTSVLIDDDFDGALPRRTSLLSHTTVDEDEIDEDQGYGLEGTRGGTVPTRVEWKQSGDRVYITGTFAAWSRKYRMHRDPATNVLSTVLDLPPGTHHVKFIVDGDMQLSNELPTAVDYTNILVNYIEVSADDIPQESPAEEKAPEGIYPPLVLPPGVESKDHAPSAVGNTQQSESEHPVEPVFYGEEVPSYLLDLDREENSNRFQRAANTVTEIPIPPSLPLFLGKSILNGTTPMKDDSSVLNMPNHTVLNHLATSSIKNEVLATSLTTRYKRKYVTTIMYRPTDVEDD